jgi:hypothetical protein
MIKNILDDEDRSWFNSILALIALFWLIGLAPWLPDWLEERGVVGDYFGGLASPAIGLASIILVYSALKAQVLANRIQIQALKDERDARKHDEHQRAIEEGFARLEKILDRVGYVRIEGGGVRNAYFGIDGAYRFAVDCKRSGGAPYLENEILIDTLCHWLFEAKLLLRKAHEAPSIDAQEVSDRLKAVYAFCLVQCLNTLLETSPLSGLDEPFHRMAREKQSFESMLGLQVVQEDPT